MVAKVTTRQLQAVGILVKNGLASSGAIAVIGNFSWESGGPDLPTRFRTAHLDNGSNGLAQWRLGRLDNYKRFVAAKHPELDQTDLTPQGELWAYFGRLDYQLLFTIDELKRDYTELHSKLMKGGSVASLTADFCWQFERPNKRMAHLSDRVAYAKAISAAIVKSPIKHDLPTQLMADVHESEQQQQVAAGMAIVPTTALALGGAGTVAHNFTVPWYAWVFVAACVFVFIAGLIAFFKQRQVAANVKSAAANVIPNAAPAVPMGTAPALAEAAPATSKLDPAAAARAKIAADAAAGERAALAASMT